MTGKNLRAAENELASSILRTNIDAYWTHRIFPKCGISP